MRYRNPVQFSWAAAARYRLFQNVRRAGERFAAGQIKTAPLHDLQSQLEMRVVIFGSGSFGTAMATAVARNGHDVVVLSRSEEIAAGINEQHKNLKYLTD